MDIRSLSVVHSLPLWFLLFSLFLPRIALLLLWLQQGISARFHMQGLVPLILAILLPRLVILYMVYVDLGLGLWFIIHLVALLIVWAGSGNYHTRRRTRVATYTN